MARSPETLFYILIFYKDGSHELYLTYASCECSALDILYDSCTFVPSLVDHIVCTTPKFL